MSCLSLDKLRRHKGKHAFRVRTADNAVKYGIAAKNIEDLLKKSYCKFQVQQLTIKNVVLEEDGTEVEEDDVLLLLPHNTCLVMLLEGQHWQPSANVSGQLNHTLECLVSSSQYKHQVLEQLQRTMTAQNNRPLRDILAKLSAAAALNPGPSNRSQDSQWFTGVDKRYKTKEAFMRERAKARVRAYLNTAQDFAKESPRLNQLFAPILKLFISKLKETDYYSCYFDRNASTDRLCMCDDLGWFACEGAYDVTKCGEMHQINPYGSLTERITFSTWNLDHRIEKSREVLPQQAQALEKKPAKKNVNWEYFYDLLFTRTNLKLVHIACHDKKEHTTAKCDPKKFYT